MCEYSTPLHSSLPVISIGDVKEAGALATFPFQLIRRWLPPAYKFGLRSLVQEHTGQEGGGKEQRSGMFAVIFATLKAKN